MSSTTPPTFGPQTTAHEVASHFPDAIKNRIFLITGINPLGISYPTAAALSSQFPTLIILTGRNLEKINSSITSLQNEYPTIQYRGLQVDLSDQQSVRKAAKELLSWPDIPHIDVVINNAGVMNLPQRTLSPDGVEMHLATNHLGHFLLTNLLMSKLLASSSARIINISSLASWLSPIRFSDLTFTKPVSALPEDERPNLTALRMGGVTFDPNDDASTVYLPFIPYAQSKTANILYTVSLNTRLRSRGVTAIALHPGEIRTQLQRNTDADWLRDVVEPRMRKTGLSWKNKEEGAAPTLFAVCAAEESLGWGEDESGKEGMLNEFKPWMGVPAHAIDKEVAEKLWGVSEELVGEKFSW